MLVGIVAEKTMQSLEKALESLPEAVDVIELRLDFLDTLEKNHLKKIIAPFKKPLIFTLRRTNMGGHFKGTEDARLALLYALGALSPCYIDLESSVREAFISKCHAAYPHIQIIRSYHHFSATPENLGHILSTMRHPGVSVYKIVTYANTSLDNLRVLNFVKQHATELPLVAHCMGPLGLPSRIMGAVLGSYFTYASIPSRNTPVAHCPDVNTLTAIYHFKHLNPKTRVYALLGNPVEHSIGHVFHNQQYKALGLNALYLKIKLNADELPAFFTQIKTLPFHGFSVTMPLKEAILPYLDKQDSNAKAIGAANTILIKNKQLHGRNTDGMGALDAIENQQSVEGQHLLIIGAGGAAKAIALEAYKRNPACMTIINRTLSKATALAAKVNGTAYDFNLQARMHHFDVIINTIPNTHQNDTMVLKTIKPYLSNQLVFMNIDYINPSSLLLNTIAQAGCTCIEALAMFRHQALQQIEHWFDKYIIKSH